MEKIFAVLDKAGVFVLEEDSVVAKSKRKYLLASREAFFCPILRDGMRGNTIKSPTSSGSGSSGNGSGSGSGSGGGGSKTRTELLQHVVNHRCPRNVPLH